MNVLSAILMAYIVGATARLIFKSKKETLSDLRFGWNLLFTLLVMSAVGFIVAVATGW